jgi:tight adherence protein B
MDQLAIVAAAVAGVAAWLIVIGLAGYRPSAVERRLDAYGTSWSGGLTAAPSPRAGGAWIGSPLVRAFGRLLERRTWSDDMATELARADLALTPAEYLILRLLAVIVGPSVGVALGLTVAPALLNPVVLIIAAFLGLLLPRFYVSRRNALRVRAFDASLNDTITLISSALRSGSSFLQAIELVVRDMKPPVSTEFRRVVREVSLGLPLEEALNDLVRRVRSEDLEVMTTAIAVHYQVGGNLAEILDTIAFTIRDRARIRGEIRTLTAMQRMSGYVVGFLPIALLLTLLVISPRFLAPMFKGPPTILGIPAGMYLLAAGGVSMAIGFLLIRRIIDIKV